MRKTFLFSAFTIFCTGAYAQEKPVARMLDSVLIRSTIQPHLPEVQSVYIFSGKKTNDIVPDASGANLAGNVSRMIFARIPGINVWDMDGAGTQVNIGTRGTDTHRSIEMNMRQNGYNTNSDMFGYPEDHYTPPMQAISEIQLVRGSAALQFGSQFGGMMNYVMKNGDSSRPFVLESEQTAGSNKFFNSFNAVGGTVGKINYYAYFDQRQGDGWRPGSAFVYQAMYGGVTYRFDRKGSIAFQFSRMNYRQQIAGGLTDAQFKQDPRQATRTRNFFYPEINIPALLFNYELSHNTQLSVTSHYLGGQRNSVQFINTPNIADTINTALGTYNPRQVDRDYYSGFTTEARLLHRYTLGKMIAVITGGIRYFTETTLRKQKGTGTTGNDFDLNLVKPYGIDLRLHTNNYAVFAENLLRVTSRFSITPGIRWELIESSLKGVINNASFPVAYTGKRNFPLLGTGLQYQVSNGTQLYGNISQAYRPYIYASITPADQVGVIDPHLKDSKGYDADLGYRGRVGDWLHFDVNLFYVYYGNRAGQLTLTKPDNSTYLYTTNIGDAVARGVEAYAEVSLAGAGLLTGGRIDLRVFNSFSYTHGRYISGQINNAGHNVSLKGNRTEGTPDYIDRAGLIFQSGSLRSTLQYSYVGKGFSDANNTASNPTGATGIVPAYHLLDWSADWAFLTHYHVSAGVNNLAGTHYFTRRINMYPGPGILPADGRTFYVSLGLKL
ncbi:MAG: TonB-dependent receptor [Chitinophagaceae bacterium]|nr:TonB-dependent receptor [Chitinophagaceae bacterium]